MNAMEPTNNSTVYSHPEVVRTFYFLLKNAYLSSNKKDINLYVKSLHRAYLQVPNILTKSLTPKQFKDLENIVFAVKNNVCFFDFLSPQPTSSDVTADDLISRVRPNVDSSLWCSSEEELEDILCEGNMIALLNQKLGTSFTFHDRQFVTEYGKIDMVCKEPRTMYVLELKKDCANHKIVGQILKYAYHFQKRYIYDLYDEVRAIAIAGNYSDYTFNQLRRLGVTMLTYEKRGSEVSLSVL